MVPGLDWFLSRVSADCPGNPEQNQRNLHESISADFYRLTIGHQYGNDEHQIWGFIYLFFAIMCSWIVFLPLFEFLRRVCSYLIWPFFVAHDLSKP